MPLPSQSARPTSRRSHMYRRSRRRRIGPPIAIALVVVSIGGLAWRLGWLPEFGGDSSAPDEFTLVDMETNGGGPSETDSANLAQPSRDRSGGASANSRTIGEDRSPAVQPETELPDNRYVHTPSAPPPRVAPATRTPDNPPDAIAREEPRHDLRPAPNAIETAFALTRSDPIQARAMLSRSLASLDLSPEIADQIRTRLGEMNEQLVFGPDAHPDDEFSRTYRIQGGDRLSTIVRRQGMLIDWRFAQRINRIKTPSKIRQGDSIKLVTGPFHVVVDKSDYRLDLYLGEDDQRIFVRSFDVGLGEHDGTPTGRFRINRSKMANPDWRDGRTGEYFAANDPKNPIGEFWLGLDGIEERTAGLESYGLHGTIEPDSIGRQKSRGCIRLRNHDIELLFELLVPGVSEVTIQR